MCTRVRGMETSYMMRDKKVLLIGSSQSSSTTPPFPCASTSQRCEPVWTQMNNDCAALQKQLIAGLGRAV